MKLHRVTFTVFKLLVALGVLCCWCLAAAPATRPNVLFIILDDLTATLSCYGDCDARTPHMDALAARGVRFDRAYTQFALCNPSRCSFLTGCYPERTKAFDLKTSLRVGLPDAVTLPQLFQNAGYTAGCIGKVFHAPDRKLKVDILMGSELLKDHDILDELKQLELDGGDLSDPPQGRGKTYNKPYGASARPDRDFTDYGIAERAMETLESFKGKGGKAKRGQAKPFFLAVGFLRPHTPYVAPKSFFDVIGDPNKIAMPTFYQPGGENLSLIPDAALRPNNNVFSYKAPNGQEAREARRAYLATTAWVDSQVGRLLAKLKELHLDDNTIIVLTGDHGYQLGEHGLWAKQTLFEEGTRVPLIVTAPGVKPGVCAGLVEQVDIYPTLAGLAGLGILKNVQGISLLPLLQNPAAKGKEFVFSTMVSTHTELIGHSVSDARFRYIEWDEGRGGRQLYDHESDPHELSNLAGKPEQAGRIASMKARLVAHLKAVTNSQP